MATNPQRVRRSLEAEICRDLAVPTRSTAAVMLRSSLGLAEVDRYGAINSGRVGRNQLIAVLAWARRVLDANLDAPAAWRGPGRNAHAAGRREKPLWLRHAFTEVTAAITDISAEDLLRWNRVVGASGEWRTRAMRVDGYDVQFSPDRSVALVHHLLARANQGGEPPALVATRLHVGLLSLHIRFAMATGALLGLPRLLCCCATEPEARCRAVSNSTTIWHLLDTRD